MIYYSKGMILKGIFAGEYMKGQWDNTRNIYEVDLFISV